LIPNSHFNDTPFWADQPNYFNRLNALGDLPSNYTTQKYTKILQKHESNIPNTTNFLVGVPLIYALYDAFFSVRHLMRPENRVGSPRSPKSNNQSLYQKRIRKGKGD
jgi:hypothetical protein